MPTLIQRAKAKMDMGTSTKDDPLFFPLSKGPVIIEHPPVFEIAGKGQVLGSIDNKKPAPPLDRVPNVDKTPPAYDKVLPWVRDIPTEGYEPPEGMFGPYDSQPPTRPHTMHDPPHTAPPPHTSRSIHPFAYGHPATLPFAAFASGQADHPEQDPVHHQHGRTRESEMLSRGAGRAQGGDEQDGSGSLGMGTFGIEPMPDTGYDQLKQTPHTHRSASPQKASPTRLPRKPPAEPLPPSPPSKSPATPKGRRVPPPRDLIDLEGTPEGVASLVRSHPPAPHVHHAHHDYPFSHEEAAKKQAQAMEAARADALARLEAARKSITDQVILPGFSGGGLGFGQKGPRITYETSTSGPSFGHIMHQDGQPLRISVPGPGMFPGAGMQHGPMMMGDPGESASGGGFFRIPFGVPMSASIPRPMLVMRNSAGVGLGLGMNMGMDGGLPEVAGSPERGRQSARSAYVESIEDEQAPARTVKTPTRRAPSADPSLDGTVRQEMAPAKTESGLQPTRPPSKAPTAKSRARAALPQRPQYHSAQPYDEREDPSLAPAIARSTGGRDNVPPPKSGADKSVAGHKTAKTAKTAKSAKTARSAATHHQHHDDRPRPPSLAPPIDAPVQHHHDHHDNHHGHDEDPSSPPSSPPGSAALSHAPSIAPTTASNVKQIVMDSKFHDETLCQLLDAARLKLIGGEARKALQRAARARVIELKDLKARGEAEVAASSLKRAKREKREKSRERPRRKSDATVKAAPTAVPELVQPTTPPEWAQTIIARLEAFDNRFSELEKQQAFQGSLGRDIQGYPDPPTQDMVGQLIGDLIDQQFMPSEFAPEMLAFQNAFSGQMLRHHNQQAAIDPIYTPSAIGTKQGTPAVGDLAPGPHRSASGEQAQVQAQAQGLDTRGVIRESITWGSEVELPQPNETFSPPRAPPAINIQAPTESNMGKSSYRVPSGPSVSHATPRTPPGMPKQDIVFEAPGRVIYPSQPHVHAHPPMEGLDRDLPPAPSESIKSNRPTPTARGVPLPEGAATQYSATGAATARLVSPPTVDENRQTSSGNNGHSSPNGYPRQTQASTVYKTAPVPATHYNPPSHYAHGPVPTHQARPVQPQAQSSAHQMPVPVSAPIPAQPHQDDQHRTPKQHNRDIIHVTDTNADETFADPWDLVTQKLYGWAMVWDDETFVRAMERISLGEQVEDCPLTIFMMMTYKRLIRNNLCSIPQKSCDKLFIPPTIASAINAAIHGKQLDNAAQILHEMWDSYRLSDSPPRVIIALARHRNENDLWTAHRFDLHSHQMTSYGISHDDSITRLKDGRPFMWWYAIRLAWPECKIPEPVDAGLQVRFETVKTLPENRKDNSLVAANTARNLLCGYRPERATDYTKMRELIWSEVKRLLHKKRTGRLIVDYDSADHVYEV